MDPDHSDGFCEDNNGGDYIRLRHIENNQFEFDVGFQCVIALRIIGTPSEIAERIPKLVCNQKGESG